MTRILSQEEIDARMSGSSAAEAKPRPGSKQSGAIIRYNFRRPDRSLVR